MDRLEKFIESKIKIENIDKNKNYKTKNMSDAYFNVFLNKLLDTHYFLYAKQQYSTKNNFTVNFPLYDIKRQDFIINIDYDLFENKPDEIIILPILIYNLVNDDIQYVHITTFHIDTQKKTLLYFDSYGLSNNKLISKETTIDLVKTVKNDLIINDIISQDYKLIVLNNSWQNHIEDPNNSWYYYGSCIVLQSMFALFYHNLLKKTLDKNINITKIFNDLDNAIKKNTNKFKELIITIYVYVMYY